MELRPYQIQCLDAMEAALERGVTRQLVVSAVGTGKTTMIAGFLERQGFPNTYGLMHRTELIKQARDRFLDVNPALKIGFDKAEFHPDFARDQVVLATVQSVGKVEGNRLLATPKDWPKIVWTDETHRAPASSYLAVMDHFGLRGDEPRRDIISIGTTATPSRLDKLGYDKIFDDVVFRYGLRDGIRDGWLADIRAWKVETSVDLSQVTVRDGDFVDAELGEIMNTPQHNKLAADVWANHCRGHRSLFFCVTKAHAHAVTETLRRAGATAETIVAETDELFRAGAIDALRQGHLDAIVNVGVMGEGVDIPAVDCVHMLRPSRSSTAYIQAVGRGVRKAPGKDHMKLFDYGGYEQDIFSIGQVFGLPDAWELNGNSLQEDATALDEIVDNLSVSVNGVRGIADLHQKLRSKETRVNLIKGSLTAADLPSKLVWVRPSRAERYVISWRNETREQVDRMKLEHQFTALEAMEPKNLFGIVERVEIWPNELGKYEAKIWRNINGQVMEKQMWTDFSLAKLVGKVESWIVEKRPHKSSLLKKSAKWAKEPASQAQVGVLRGKGVPASFGAGLTKREASILMGLPRDRVKALFG